MDGLQRALDDGQIRHKQDLEAAAAEAPVMTGFMWILHLCSEL